MTNKAIWLALPFFAAIAGCPSPQTPYTFVAPGDAGTTTDTAARTLAAAGYPVGAVDRQTGIVSSKWIAKGIQQADGSLFVRRFTITVAPSGPESSVAVRLDVQKCPPGGYTAGDMQVMGTCHVIDGVFGGDQADIDALGGKLRAALSPAATTATTGATH